jgi:hypothetical protein
MRLRRMSEEVFIERETHCYICKRKYIAQKPTELLICNKCFMMEMGIEEVKKDE